MLDQKIKKTGTILMHNGKICLEGFEVDDAMCRELAIHAMLWAVGELQREIVADIEKPGGSGNVSIDLPDKVRKALDLPDYY